MTTLRRLLSVFVSICLYAAAISAHAGAANVMLCSTCQTTTDFANAAESQYYTDTAGQYYPTTYQVVSNSSPMTAYIAVSGGYIWLQEPTYGTWYQYNIPYAAYPVDVNGNPESGSEITLETGYAILDEVDIGTNRGAPVTLRPAAVITVTPDDPLWSFPNSDDAQVGDELDSVFYNYLGAVGNGDYVTVKFHDGTLATYQVFEALPGHHTWVWVKASLNGVPIGKDGKPLPNPNPSPQPTPGTGLPNPVEPAQLGPSIDGNQYQWQLQSAGTCVTQQTISINGQVDSTGTFYVPCP